MITARGSCSNCGAPLELDQGGNCRWCHAHLHDEPRHAPAGHGPGLGLVPAGTDDCSTSAPFLYLTLAALGSGLSTEPVVREYARANPAQATRIRALSTAVSAAVAEDLRTLNGTARGHHWNSELKRAGTGPEEFRQLRAEVPRR